MEQVRESSHSLVEATGRTPRALQAEVMGRLANEPGLNAFGIGVSARLDGVVSLSGRVPTLIEKRMAVQIARRAPGVRAIVDDLQVELDPAAERDDVDLADAVVRSLEWNASVPDDRIDVIVADGIVTLYGAVDWPFQRSAAEQAVRGLVGVRGIQNRIVVATRVAATELQRDVELALARHAPLLVDRIKVEVIDQAVVLKGSVRDWWEWEAAEQLARSVAHVSDIDNRLEIEMEKVVFDALVSEQSHERANLTGSATAGPYRRSAPRDVLLFCGEIDGRQVCSLDEIAGSQPVLGVARADTRLRIGDAGQLLVLLESGENLSVDDALSAGVLTIVGGFDLEVLKNLFQMTMHNEIRSDLIFRLLRSAADPLSIDLATSDERITLLDAEGHVRTRIEDPRWWRVHDPDRAGEIADRLIAHATAHVMASAQ